MNIFGISVNNKGKTEKNSKIKDGNCIFPFKYKWRSYNKCCKTKKGDICATEVNPKTQTLKKYGYCAIKGIKKTRKKLIIVESIDKNKIKLNSKERDSAMQQQTMKNGSDNQHASKPRTTKKKRKLKIIENNTNLKAKKQFKQMQQGRRLNEEFISILNEFTEYMRARGEVHRANAYDKASIQVSLIKNDITNIDQLKDIPHIGKTILEKLHEYVETGKIVTLEKERQNPMIQLTKVYGIGPKKAQEFINKGILTVNDLKNNMELLTNNMQAGVKYFEDIEAKIKRSEIDEYKTTLAKIFKNTAPNGSKFDIVGSYRRGAKISSDIDIIITNEFDNIDSFNNFIDALISEKIIIEVLSRGKVKSMVIAKLPNKRPRRVDLLYSSPEEYPFAILYFTGSKTFNTVQRQRALDIGYSLNEHGMHKMESGKKGAKVNHEFLTEKDIFEFLGMKYIEPHERVNANSVILLSNNNNNNNTAEQLSENAPEKIMIKKQVKNITAKKSIVKHNKKSTTTQVIENVVLFQKEGLSYIKKLSEDELSDMIHEANNQYYCNSTSILTDNEYDILREYTLKIYPDNLVASEGHTTCKVEKNKVHLPYEMWSMDKIKPDTDALPKWIKTYTGPYVISAKLDGVSGMYSTDGDKPKLYTRGNGIFGQDVSHLIPYLKLPKTKNIVIRGEFIISKDTFQTKYATTFANPRNFVAGLINKKTIDSSKFKDISFVVYELIKPEMKPSDQLAFLSEENVEVVENTMVKNISNDLLSEQLIELRNNYKYEIDGIICIDNNIHNRTSGNPTHAFAFKMVLSDNVAESKVLDVIWTASKDGYLKPRVQIEPVTLGGVEINYATGFNAKFIKENKIGVGALIQLIRSGDVIPHITCVIQPAENVIFPTEEYIWNESQVDILLKNKIGDSTVNEKIITAFFKILGVEGFGPGNAKRIIQSGNDTIPKILKMDVNDFMEVGGFKEKLAIKIYNGIKNKLEQITVSELMQATNIFGRGFATKRFATIIKAYPDILTSNETNQEKLNKLISVEGMALKSSQKFMDHLQEFMQWIKETHLEYKLNTIDINYTTDHNAQDTSHPLYGKKWVITGTRNPELTEKLNKLGAIQSSGVSKNTFVVLVSTLDDMSGKTEKAHELNIPIMLQSDFISKYNL